MALYRAGGDVLPRQEAEHNQVAADITTSFTLLLAIFFPSVTGKYIIHWAGWGGVGWGEGRQINQ